MKKILSFITLSAVILSSAVLAGPGHDMKHQHGQKAGAVGMPAMASAATKTIYLTTENNMRFKFAKKLELQQGDIVKFVITNNDKIPHEFSIGDEAEQIAHRKMMMKMPNMVHNDGNTVTLSAGETKELTWRFNQGSEVLFACNIPGHFEAGMLKKVTINKIMIDHKKSHSHD